MDSGPHQFLRDGTKIYFVWQTSKIFGFGLYDSIWEPISIDFGEATDRQEQVLAQAFFPY